MSRVAHPGPPATEGQAGWRGISLAELVADGIVHGVALVAAVVAGSLLLVLALLKTAPDAFPALLVYVVSLIAVFSASAAFNLWPISPVKRWLARLDQAAIFLFIAGTYTPFLAVIGGTRAGSLLTAIVWGLSLVGVALKLIVPERLGRLAILLYLAVGWSGVMVFHTLIETLPRLSIWLILAGGLVYSIGIVFHLWERLKFHTALWHGFVLVAATLHFVAVLDALVISRL